MTNTNQDIRSDIQSLETQIDRAEDTDPAYLNKWIRELRHRVFYVHGAIEDGMELLIAKDIVPDLTNPNSNEEAENVFAQRIKLYSLLQHTPFQRKLSLACDLKLISKDLKKTFSIVNRIRNEFAHPDAYKIKRYTDYQLTKDTLISLVNGLNVLQDLFR